MIKVKYPEELPESKLPPADALPEKIYALPELHYPKKLNIGKIFVDDAAKKFGNKAAILYEDKVIRYDELRKIVNRIGNALLEYGIKKSDRVALVTPNVPEHIYFLMACWKIGAIPVLCSHLEKSESLTYKFNDSDSRIAIVTNDSVEEVVKAKEVSCIEDIIAVEKVERSDVIDLEEFVKDAETELEPADTTRDHIGRIIYTSGTTGLPKGVLCTYADILSASDTHGKYILKITSQDVIGGHPYFFFAFGSVNFTFLPWRFGATLSVLRRFTPEKMFETIEKHRITVLCCVPTAFNMMLQVRDAEKRYDLSSLRIAQSAGEHLPKETIIEFERRFGVRILDSLGSSELNYWVSTRDDTPAEKLGSTGLPIPGYEVRLIDPETGEEVDVGVGVMYVRGPVGFQYWNKPEKQRALVKDGWSNTELIFRKDEDGYFWYISREDEMIVTSGYKIAPTEVESVIRQHPAVREVAVVPKPDKIRGNIVKAFIVLKDGFEPSDDLAREIQDFVKARIEPFKYPREIEFVEDLPKTITGKIKRKELILKEREGV